MRAVAMAAVAITVITTNLNAGLNPETGAYVFQRYSAKQYGASPQNWGVAQDRRGILYFANTDGLLEFDGNTWRPIRLPGRSVRSVGVDQTGTVYVGGSGEFGYLRPDATGTMQFVSLMDRVTQQDRGFADVWRVLPAPEGVYFSASRRLFRLNKGGTIQVWRPEKKFGRAFYVLNALYIQAVGAGLMRMGRDDRLAPVPGGERFASGDQSVNAGVALGVSGKDGAVFTTNSDLYRLTGSGVQPFPTGADSYLASSLAYSMQMLPGGEIAVGTRKGGLVLLSRDGAVDRILSTANGLADDWVSEIRVDSQGGVWLAQNNGITRFNPGLSLYGKSERIEGDVQFMARHDGALYAGTTSGLFRLKPQPGMAPQFERIGAGKNGVTSTVWALMSLEKDLLAATDQGVFVVLGNQATLIPESGREAYDLSISPRDPDTVYVARQTAVTVLRRHGSGWTRTADFESPGEGFRTVLEDADGQVWATTRGNIWRFDFRGQSVRSEKFGIAQGVPLGWINARRLNGRVVFATATGLKRYDQTLKSFVPDPSLGTEFSDGSRDVNNIFEGAAGDVWITGERGDGYHGILRRGDGHQWRPMPLRRSGISEIYWMSADADGTIWAAGADLALYRWEPAIAGDPDHDFHVMTRRVQVSGSKENWYGGVGALNAAKLPWRENSLRFEFAAPFYEEPAEVEYQTLLQGSDNNWSAWSHEITRDYTHLPEGTYRFHVRARTPHGASSEDASLSFGVLPPWYRTWWAYSIYVVFGGFAVWGIVRLRTRQLEEDNRKLEGIVEERTVEVRRQRDEIQVQEGRSQSLLLNILPAKVADELKTTGTVQPVGFDDVTVCFTDFVGFTLSSEQMAPGYLVSALNEYFTIFDEIIDRYGLEKLKTIGDSYMFASGLPEKRASHAVDAVMAALEMVEVVKELGAREDGTGWNIRVGLHSGPVVAGVVGIRKFAFDIWGNTVNFAARMESSGVAGRVNMSERTWSLMRGLIDGEARGDIRTKEGREVPMFLAVGPARELVESELENGIPVRFRARYREAFGEEPRGFPEVKKTAALTAQVQ
jgi:class 3 adenylate cyclase